jgi:hypothetical protein
VTTISSGPELLLNKVVAMVDLRLAAQERLGELLGLLVLHLAGQRSHCTGA